MVDLSYFLKETLHLSLVLNFRFRVWKWPPSHCYLYWEGNRVLKERGGGMETDVFLLPGPWL